MRSNSRRWRGPTLLVAALALGGGANAATVQLDGAAVTRAGIVVETLRPTRMTPSVAALGIVLDPAPLIRLSGEIAAAGAAVAGANAQVALDQKLTARAAQLYRGRLVSALDYERMQGDLGAAVIALAKARVGRTALVDEARINWGDALTAALETGGEPLPQLAADQAILVGLSLPPGVTLAAPPQHAAATVAGLHFTLHLLGPVPRMLGGYPGQNLLYEAAAERGISIGATVAVALPAGRERVGVVVPWSAVLWRNGRALVFRAGSDDSFQPVPIATDLSVAGGYFESTALAAGDRVVVHGTALLLGAGGEKPQPGGEDED